MAKISKFVKLDKDVLLEYIYDDGNLISESYDILVDSRDRRQSYIAGSSSIPVIQSVINYLKLIQ